MIWFTLKAADDDKSGCQPKKIIYTETTFYPIKKGLILFSIQLPYRKGTWSKQPFQKIVVKKLLSNKLK